MNRTKLASVVAKLMGTSNAHTASVKPVRGPYNFVPHCGRRERLRRLRQTYYGQLPMSQFRSPRDYHAASLIYLEFVSGKTA